MTRDLIVTAEDFGQTAGVNRGVIAAHEDGIVTSASLMVHGRAAVDAARYARRHTSLSLGLHLDLGDWTYRNGRWIPLYERVPLSDLAAVATEVSRQLSRFRELVGDDPTHLDSHRHVHLRAPVRWVAARVAHELAVPLRDFAPDIHYCGALCTRMADNGRLSAIPIALGPAIAELACHPGDGSDREDAHHRERTDELKMLCDAQVRAYLDAKGVRLRSFGEVNRDARAA